MFHTLCIAATLATLPVLSAADPAPGYVKYTVATGPSLAGAVQRRQSETGLAKRQEGNSYTISLAVGTPSQNVSVQLDTGSNDLWMNPTCDNSGLVPASAALCHSLGQFNPAQSSTYRSLNQSHNTFYGGGNVSFAWSKDDISVGSITLKSQQFGVAYNSYREPFGILGIGPRVFASDQPYTLFLDNLVVQNITQSRAFSLDLRSIESTDGSIIFGGLDTGKYVGALEKLPMVMTKEEIITKRYAVNLDSIALNNGQTSDRLSSRSIPVLLDSGSSYTILPSDIYLELGKRIPTAKFNILAGGYSVDCSVGNQTGSLDFAFAGKTISVAYKDFIIRDSGLGLCLLGFSDANATGIESSYILGDTFLRAAYVVYDPDNQNIHVAQAASCGTNIVPIGKGPNAVPSAKGQCSTTGPPTGKPTTYPSAAARLPAAVSAAVLALAAAVLM